MISVVLAEDMHMVRGALVSLLRLESDINVVAEIVSGDDILPAVLKHRPDVAILDIDLPGKDGLSAAADIHEQAPETRTLILTSIGKPGALRRALSAKVDGFLLKDAPPHELAEAVRRVHSGRRVIDGELALAAFETDECPLTARELDVLRRAADGSDVPEIAAQLYLTAGTVRNYLASVTTKLNARNRVDAVRIAREAGWV
ncbi:response regulator transcription factor [Streptomonospora nanhaiensis]|uniref:Two-component system response regulator DesR n=1 Tax=Streptomonospora nanhaiensis TaxID=1323731 RepID=A0A853BW70_9ACTN|nr:response regulator transcription factor [Streptomonospora nanhaiensis]MBV2367017.1 response regulator transcription factor [Streptomonospora nanhaiensis]MBX9391927.1 response regulator transcription factor [Streptomonospora nanhaiensis]NYI99046.1 two-component system response regulator DesR [Streptomonospora nanhaiensis]